MKVIGIHYCNIHEYISDIRFLLKDNNDFIKVDDVLIEDLLNRDDIKFIIIKNDYEYITSFVELYGSDTEKLRLHNFLNNKNVEIIDYAVTENFMFAIMDFCEQNGYRCLVTRRDVHRFNIRLAFYCKKYAMFYNTHRNEYSQIILTRDICLSIILKHKLKLKLSYENNLLFDYFYDSLLLGKDMIVLKSTMDNVMDYIYLNGDEEDILSMNNFFSNIITTIITDMDLYISQQVSNGVRDSNYDLIKKYRLKYTQDTKPKLNRKSINCYEVVLSKSLNIPMIVSHQKCLPYGDEKSRALLIYSKIHPQF